MNDDAAGATLLLVGVMLVRLEVTGVYQRYVKASLGPWLLLAGALVACVGVALLARTLRRAERPEPAADPAADQPAPGHDHDHDHPRDERVGWLLLAPVLTLLLVAPPALGSFGVGRAAAVQVGQGAQVWKQLPVAGPPRAMTILELVQRAGDRRGASLAGATVQLTGFVAAGSDATSFTLARYQIACCAADAVADVARVTGIAGQAPARDAWVRVTARFASAARDGTPVVRATSVQVVPAPEDPYE